MEEESLGTVQWPDLNLPAFDPYWARDPSAKESDPRIQARPEGRVWQRRRDDGALVSYFGGLVELANLPDFPGFDFRVHLSLVDTPEGGATLAPTAVAIIVGRDAGPVRGGDFAKAPIARAVLEAGKALALVSGGDGEPAAKDIRVLLPHEEAPVRRRSSPQEVRVEMSKVVRRYRKLTSENGGEVPYGYARRVAEHVYKNGDREAQGKVRKRLQAAARLGMVEPAAGPGSKRRG